MAAVFSYVSSAEGIAHSACLINDSIYHFKNIGISRKVPTTAVATQLTVAPLMWM